MSKKSIKVCSFIKDLHNYLFYRRRRIFKYSNKECNNKEITYLFSSPISRNCPSASEGRECPYGANSVKSYKYYLFEEMYHFFLCTNQLFPSVSQNSLTNYLLSNFSFCPRLNITLYISHDLYVKVVNFCMFNKLYICQCPKATSASACRNFVKVKE